MIRFRYHDAATAEAARQEMIENGFPEEALRVEGCEVVLGGGDGVAVATISGKPDDPS